MNGKSLRIVVLQLLLSLGIAAVYCLTFNIELSGARGYSSDFVFRRQTDAFREGRLSLGDTPFDLQSDFAWGNGTHQVWGLGVPLVRLPFEFLSQALTGNPFPDRWVIIIFVYLVAFVALLTIGQIGLRLAIFPFSTVLSRAYGWVLACWILLVPPLTTLSQTRFLRYEEAVFFSQFSLVLASCLTVYSWMNRKGSGYVFAGVALGLCLFFDRLQFFLFCRSGYVPVVFCFVIPSALYL